LITKYLKNFAGKYRVAGMGGHAAPVVGSAVGAGRCRHDITCQDRPCDPLSERWKSL